MTPLERLHVALLAWKHEDISMIELKQYISNIFGDIAEQAGKQRLADKTIYRRNNHWENSYRRGVLETVMDIWKAVKPENKQ